VKTTPSVAHSPTQEVSKTKPNESSFIQMALVKEGLMLKKSLFTLVKSIV
jgi:hypothetical protein